MAHGFTLNEDSPLKAADWVRFLADLLTIFCKVMKNIQILVLEGLMKMSLEFVNLVWRFACRWGQRDSQITLKWLDTLNEVSTRN